MGPVSKMNDTIINTRLKRSIRHLGAWTCYLTNPNRIFHKGKILILSYHRVLRDQDRIIRFIQPGMYVTESVFDFQMKTLAAHYRLLSFTDLLEMWRDKAIDRNTRYAVVTFDDGWLDNYLHAYPILKKYKIPATIFLPTSLIDTDHWFWHERLIYLCTNGSSKWLKDCVFIKGHSDLVNQILTLIYSVLRDDSKYKKQEIDGLIKKLKPFPLEAIEEALTQFYQFLDISHPAERALLNWNEIELMSKNGITFGSHACTHRILTGLPTSEVKYEIEESLKMLKEKRINDVSIFSYPNGNNNSEIKKVLGSSGYQAAVTTEFGIEGRAPRDIFMIKRIGVHQDISSTIPLFLFHLSGFSRL